MGTAERRNEIMKILCRRRHETIRNLASELGVSERTIRRDIEILSLTEPIYTQTGLYRGGIYVVENYSVSRMYLSDKEIVILHKLYKMALKKWKCVLTDDELSILKDVITNYSKPLIKKEGKKK